MQEHPKPTSLRYAVIGKMNVTYVHLILLCTFPYLSVWKTGVPVPWRLHSRSPLIASFPPHPGSTHGASSIFLFLALRE